MSHDPLGLFEPNDKIVVKRSNGWLTWILVIAVAVLFVNTFTDTFRWERQEEREEQRDEQDRQDRGDSKIDRAGGIVVFIHERKGMPFEHELLLRDMQEWAEKNNCGFRSLDDELPEVAPIIEYAKGNGVSVPFAAFTDSDKALRSAIPWPKTTDDLEALFK